EVAVHGALHGAAVDEYVGLGTASAEDRAVAVREHADLAGVIRRELHERIAFAANGHDDAVLLHLVDGAFDLLAANLGIGQTLPDVADGEQTAAPLAEKVGNRLFDAGGTREGERLRQRTPRVSAS